MRESRTYGSVRGARCEARPYRDRRLRRLAMTAYYGTSLRAQRGKADWPPAGQAAPAEASPEATAVSEKNAGLQAGGEWDQVIRVGTSPRRPA
jgi:hypothetical protein